jgi:hypothetical protein
MKTNRVTMVDDLDRVVNNWGQAAYPGFQDTGPVVRHQVYIDTNTRKIITVMDVEVKDD